MKDLDEKHGQVSSAVCSVQAALSSTGSIASFSWTVMIALNIYLTVTRSNRCLQTRLAGLPHLISWGLPIIIAIVTLSEKRYGLNPCTGTAWWCWVKLHSGDRTIDLLAWQLITGKLWEISAYIAVVVCYTLVRIYISSHVC